MKNKMQGVGMHTFTRKTFESEQAKDTAGLKSMMKIFGMIYGKFVNKKQMMVRMIYI